MSETVIEHVLGRLKSIGIDHILVPGDYAFPVEDAIMKFPGIEWVGCCNELNAAYAAFNIAYRALGYISKVGVTHSRLFLA